MYSTTNSGFCVGDVLHGTAGSYMIESFLGYGSYAEVVSCRNVLTDETVAVKIMRDDSASYGDEEAAMYRQVNELDEGLRDNIIKFIEHFAYEGQVCLVFEKLDKSLNDIMNLSRTPMTLHDIRIVTKGMLKALNALKSINIAHADIKIDNIVRVSDSIQPFEVKLIDFGLATHVSRLWLGSSFQVVGYKAPEIMLGLPLSEAIDMWSLGCVLTILYLGAYMFTLSCEYQYMREIVQLLGQPNHQMLNSGMYTTDFFHKVQVSPSARWRLNTPEEYSNETGEVPKTRRFKFSSLDDLVTQVPARNRIEDEDPRPFVNLLKRMLTINPDERITPSEALEHPFITEEYFDSDSDQLEANDETTATAGGTAADSDVVPPAAETQIPYKKTKTFRIGGILCGQSGKYQIEDLSRMGKYGRFVQCVDVTTKKKMFVKVWLKQFAKFGQEETDVLRKVNNVDENLRENLVKCTDHFIHRRYLCLAYEMLDLDLLSIMEKRFKPMTLHDIRIIAEDLLQALNVLKSIKIAHGDIKPQKVMIEPSLSKPFNVKLVGFGYAAEVCRLWRGTCCQEVGYRAPEVTLGQPLTEAIDMWSLGCVLAFLYLNEELYSTHCEYQCIRETVKRHGQPNHQLLNSGIFTSLFFNQTYDSPSAPWYLRTARGYWLKTGIVAARSDNNINDLNDLKNQQPARTEFENEDPQTFVDLLIKILIVDPEERITPTEALEHDFIRDRHVHSPSVHDFQLKPDPTSLTDEECEQEQSSDEPSSSASSSKVMGSNGTNYKTTTAGRTAADNDDDPPATENLDEATAPRSNERNSDTADPTADGNNDGQTPENLDETGADSLSDRTSVTSYATTEDIDDDPPATENLDEATAARSNERNSDTADPTSDGNNGGPPETLTSSTAGTSEEPPGTNDPSSPASVNQDLDETENGTCEEPENFVEVKAKKKWFKRVQLFFSRARKSVSCCSKNTVHVVN